MPNDIEAAMPAQTETIAMTINGQARRLSVTPGTTLLDLQTARSQIIGGVVATPAAIANAAWHATGRRMRELPITIDKVIGA